MPDLIGIANDLKLMPDQGLARELQDPSGLVPPYLILGELQRRQLMRAGGGAERVTGTSVLQDTLNQLERPTPTGPPPPAGITPPAGGQPSANFGAPAPGTPPANLRMPPMRTMQEGGLIDDSDTGNDDYLTEMMLREGYARGDLLPGTYGRGGRVRRYDEGGEADDDEPGADRDYDPTPAEQDLLNQIAARESGGNPKARNPGSTASGMFQFINPTWQATARETGVGTEHRSAADAPLRDQQINALHLLRQYGPNSPDSWAASGPYAVNPAGPAGNWPSVADLVAQASDMGPEQPAPAPVTQPAAPPPTPIPAATRPVIPEQLDYDDAVTARNSVLSRIPDWQTLYQQNAAAIGAQFGKFDDQTSRAGIQWLMNQAQQNMHPRISDILLRIGAGLLSTPAAGAGFGQQLGASVRGLLGDLDKQQQEGRQDWVHALQLGIELEDKQRAYQYNRAQLASSATNAQAQHWQTQLEQSQRQVTEAHNKLLESKAYQTQQRTDQTLDTVNQQRTAAGQLPIQNIEDPLVPYDQYRFAKFGTQPTEKLMRAAAFASTLPGGPKRPEQMTAPEWAQFRAQDKTAAAVSLPAQAAEDRAHILAQKNGIAIGPGQSALDALRGANRYDLAQQAAEDTATTQAREDAAKARKLQQDTARSDRSFQANSTRVNVLAKPYEDMVPRLDRLQATLAQATPLADALVAPELLTVVAGGAGSGLKMNNAEIERIVGGRNAWQSLQSAVNQWQLDPSKPFLITPAQRNQMNQLLNAVQQKAATTLTTINDARARMLDATDPDEHRKIVAELEKNLTASLAPPPAASGPAAPQAGKRYQLNNREIVPRADGWYYKDTGGKVQ